VISIRDSIDKDIHGNDKARSGRLGSSPNDWFDPASYRAAEPLRRRTEELWGIASKSEHHMDYYLLATLLLWLATKRALAWSYLPVYRREEVLIPIASRILEPDCPAALTDEVEVAPSSSTLRQQWTSTGLPRTKTTPRVQMDKDCQTEGTDRQQGSRDRRRNRELG